MPTFDPDTFYLLLLNMCPRCRVRLGWSPIPAHQGRATDAGTCPTCEAAERHFPSPKLDPNSLGLGRALRTLSRRQRLIRPTGSGS